VDVVMVEIAREIAEVSSDSGGKQEIRLVMIFMGEGRGSEG
jgi:hypothetical protein